MNAKFNLTTAWEQKEAFRDACKQEHACREEFSCLIRAIDTNNKQDFIDVLCSNFNWCYHRKLLDTALPENLSVGGSLYLRGTQITALPENLSVGGSLYLRGTQITALPEKFKNKIIR